jgi:hypothetical protein
MATKKITELPLITALSGSGATTEGFRETLIPVVVGEPILGGLNGTTNRITAENFSKFVNAYNATTSSNTFIGAQTINGNLTVTGNQVISGRLTVYEVVAQYETASILFSTGSTKLGDQLTDTHEFTGSTNITGSIIVDGNLLLNGASLNNSFVRIHQATGSLQNFTSSQADRNLDLSIVTGSLNQFTASQDDRNFVISQFTASQLIVNTGLASVTASLNNFSGSTNAFTGAIEQTTASIHLATASLNYFYSFSSSQLVVNTGLASVTASLNNFSGSTNAFTGGIEKTTASIHLATASLNYFYQSTSSLNGFTSSQADRNLTLSIVTGSLNRFTASQDDRNFVISQFTSSTNAHIVGISDFTSSQLAVNLSNSIYTASVDSHIVGISTYTSSVRDTLARVHQATRSLELHSGSMVGVTNGLMAYTASNSTLNTGLRGEIDGIEAYTASLKAAAIVSSSTQVQNYDVFALNSNLYTSTGSLIGITNGLMAFTAALDNTYATDAQLYQLYQATCSIELTTGSLIGITNGLMAFTAALDNTYATDAQLLPILQATQSLELLSGSLIGITNGLMAFTAALDSTYATDAQLYQLYQATQSLELHSGSMIGITNGLMAFTAALDSTYATDAQLYQLYAETASIKAEIGGIEAYTASLKGAAIISSSQQITNYYKFAETASANIFYGNQSITGSLRVTGSLKVGDWFHGEGVANTAKLDIRTGPDRGLKVTGAASADVIITAYRGASDDMVRTMRLEGSAINIYIGDGNANTGSSVASFNTNGLGFESGKGIDFSATSNSSGTMTSELLNDYEEGTWTPTLTDNASANVYSSGTRYGFYTKVGRIVTATAVFDATTCVAGNSVKVGGLPFTVTNTESRYPGFNSHTMGTAISSTTIHGGYARQAETNFQLLQRDSNSTVNFASGTFSMFLTFIYVV